MAFWEKLGLDMHAQRAVTLVGGGGKTSLMYALAHEACQAGRTVIVTTSTHIMPHPKLFLTDDPDPAWLRRCVEEHGIITLGTMARADKLCGPEEIGPCLAAADVVIVEGDGARRLPLKAPAEHEPVIPRESAAVVAVAGMDSVGKPIGEICHRPELVCTLLGKTPERLVTPEDVARILTSPRGGRKCVGERMLFRCALNKADVNPPAAAETAALLSGMGVHAAVTTFREEERGGRCWF